MTEKHAGPGDLDPGIADAVHVLRAAGINTSQSCEGGDGHTRSEPIVEFRGDFAEALRAVAAAVDNGIPIQELRRVWHVRFHTIEGPWWALSLRPGAVPDDPSR